MATASPSSSTAKGKDPSRPCACGSMISSKDSHPLCIACLGVRHAQAALANPDCCPHCSQFPLSVLECRVRVTATNKGDPSLSAPPAEMNEVVLRAQCSWGELMDEISPELPPLFESDPLAGDKEEEDEDDEAIARLLEEDLEEDEEDAILPPNLSSRPGSDMGESPSPMPGELDLIEMCRRAAAKLSIDWPSQQEGQGAERDLYDGKRLEPQQIPQKVQVQNAHNKNIIQYYSSQRLVYISRSEGRLLSHKYLSSAQKIPQVCLSGHSLQIFDGSFRFGISPTNFYEMCQGSSNTAENGGSQSVSLFGRSPPLCSVMAAGGDRYESACVSFKRLRLQNETKSCLVPTQEIIYLDLRLNSDLYQAFSTKTHGVGHEAFSFITSDSCPENNECGGRSPVQGESSVQRMDSPPSGSEPVVGEVRPSCRRSLLLRTKIPIALCSFLWQETVHRWVWMLWLTHGQTYCFTHFLL